MSKIKEYLDTGERATQRNLSLQDCFADYRPDGAAVHSAALPDGHTGVIVADFYKRGDAEFYIKSANAREDIRRLVEGLEKLVNEWQKENRGSTHWEGCEQHHSGCWFANRLRALIKEGG